MGRSWSTVAASGLKFRRRRRDGPLQIRHVIDHVLSRQKVLLLLIKVCPVVALTSRQRPLLKRCQGRRRRASVLECRLLCRDVPCRSVMKIVWRRFVRRTGWTSLRRAASVSWRRRRDRSERMNRRQRFRRPTSWWRHSSGSCVMMLLVLERRTLLILQVRSRAQGLERLLFRHDRHHRLAHALVTLK